ncbi:hypothetical protein [Chryseobacterium wangxinyae]|uniref:hypothetical protein n=1 Tax=Chryseobacterium sp. CY353 TaxID=2997334 RepID=UPI00226EBABB|nr:hypothetical protein [Chryseobacterium sp. CY353]MCY0969724.1 hypothetical protein [Chryseobacterium sp. CY353]
MENFHKYCLSVLLVIVCSNVSAHSNNGCIKSLDYKHFYEIYNEFLKNDCGKSLEFCLREKSIGNFTKTKAVEVSENCNVEQNNSLHNQKSIHFSKDDIYYKILKNFEKQSKQNDFAENIYFKSKVAKIRNKDYLDLKKIALTR